MVIDVVNIKILLHRTKPVAVFLAEQQSDIELLFFNYQIHYKEFDISPTFTIKGSVIKVLSERGEYSVRIDKQKNISQYPFDDVPFVILGDGDILLRMAISLDKRKEEFLELDQKKKRSGMLFGDDEESSGGMGDLFSSDDHGSESNEDSSPDILPVSDDKEDSKDEKPAA